MYISSIATDEEYIAVSQTKPKTSLRGINAYRAAVVARAARGATQTKGWDIATQEETTENQFPISSNAGGRFRNRGRNYRGRGARKEMLDSHRRFVDAGR